MMTSGLLVCLASETSLREQAMAELRSCPQLTLGEQQGSWLTAALQTDDAEESERWHHWMQEIPGVRAVEVVFVHWDDDEAGVGRHEPR